MASRTVYSVLAETAARNPELPALYQGGRTYTWNEYRTAVEEVAAGLRSLGIGRGDVVALASETRAEFHLADIGVMTNGSIAAALYTAYPAAEQCRTLRACHARVLFVESPKTLRALAKEDGFPHEVLPILMTGEVDGVMTLDQLRERGRSDLASHPELPEVSPDDAAVLYMTSGAMGEPKMGLATHKALVANIALGPRVLNLGPDDAFLAFLSPAHVMQRLVTELLPVYAGVPVWFAESLFRLPQEFLRVQPTIFLAPPRLWERVYASIQTEVGKRGRLVRMAFRRALALGLKAEKLKQRGRRPLLLNRMLLAVADRVFFRRIRARFGGRLRVCASGSAPLSKTLAEFFLATGLPLIEGYGLTEGGVVSINRPGKMRPGSIGQALPEIEFRIDADGELLVRGETLFAGYFEDPAATAEVMRGGWLHTGDLAEIDSDGYVFITGRKKEVIVSSNGRKIYPARIEALFGLEPIVNHVVIAGERRPHASALITVNPAVAEALPGMARWQGCETGELIAAPPVMAAVRAAVDRVNAQLADFEQIRKYTVLDRDFSIDAGELTATMKVRRARALENFGAAIDALYPVRE